jgi:hypothetical protein
MFEDELIAGAVLKPEVRHPMLVAEVGVAYVAEGSHPTLIRLFSETCLKVGVWRDRARSNAAIGLDRIRLSHVHRAG